MIGRLNLRSTFYAKIARQVSNSPLSTDRLADAYSRRSYDIAELKKMSVDLQNRPTAALTAAYYKRLNDLGMN